MKILVGSVYSGVDDHNLRWRNLQHKFLERSTESFDHVSVIAGKSQGSMPSSICTLNAPLLKNKTGSGRHMAGLRCLFRKMREMAEDYDRFLILDSDAFPIYKNWVKRLEVMKKDYPMAMVRRFEVYDLRPHLCVGYMNRKSFMNLKFGIIRRENLLGSSWADVNIQHKSPQKHILPLGRTNRVNLHYLLYAIYGDLFYHHGSATNTKAMEKRYKRASKITACSDFYRHIDLGKWETPEGHTIRTEQFWDDPSKFIIDMGWGHDKYVDLNHD